MDVSGGEGGGAMGHHGQEKPGAGNPSGSFGAFAGASGAALKEFLRPLAKVFAEAVLEELSDGDTVGQEKSPLGSRLHRAAVRRRIGEFESGELRARDAWIVGKRCLLTRAALTEELGRVSDVRAAKGPGVKKAKNTQSPQAAELDQFQRELIGGLRHLNQVK